MKRVLTNEKWEKRGNTDYEVKSFLVTVEVQDIIGRIEKTQWILPELQRSVVWDKQKQQKFIDSLLKGYPIPGIMLVQATDEQYILDGQQRISTLISFFKNGFKTENGDKKYSNKLFSQLEEEDQKKIMRTVLGVQVVESKNPDQDTTFMYEIFARINSGGVALTRQEIRNALNDGKAMLEIKNFAANLMSKMPEKIFPSFDNENDIIEWIFRINYFIDMGFNAGKIENIQHINGNKNVPLDKMLDLYAAAYFEENEGTSENLIGNFNQFLSEIERTQNFEWLHSFSGDLNRTAKISPTFLDTLALYFGINQKLDKFRSQLEGITNTHESTIFEQYSSMFQQRTLNIDAIKARYEHCFTRK